MGRHRRTAVAERDEVATMVLGYLLRHPAAADTLDGIVDWWLPQQRYETAHCSIERSLRELVLDGALRSEALPDGSVLYALNQTDDAKRLGLLH
jgi:hypothetical protein